MSHLLLRISQISMQSKLIVLSFTSVFFSSTLSVSVKLQFISRWKGTCYKRGTSSLNSWRYGISLFMLTIMLGLDLFNRFLVFCWTNTHLLNCLWLNVNWFWNEIQQKQNITKRNWCSYNSRDHHCIPLWY